MPRPTRFRSTRFAAGFRFDRLRFSGNALRVLCRRRLDLDEVTDLPQHTGELRALRMLDRAADFPEAERAQRAAMALALPDLAAHLRDPHLRHYEAPSASAGAADGVSGVPSSAATMAAP